jgi:hypothetical protein
MAADVARGCPKQDKQELGSQRCLPKLIFPFC